MQHPVISLEWQTRSFFILAISTVGRRSQQDAARESLIRGHISQEKEDKANIIMEVGS